MEDLNELNATVFDIQGLSVHDGPGCRTVIFLKGCPLHCSWCSNPEGIQSHTEPLYNPQKCVLDAHCVKDCEQKAIHIAGKMLLIDRRRCIVCETFSCISNCYTEALRKPAYQISLGALFKLVQRDRKFWGAAGGITLSGGEPFQQADFARHFLKACHESYIDTAIETCGNIAWKLYEPSLPFIDWIYFDLKHLDPEKHRLETGYDNSLILSNAKKLATHFSGRLVFRTPIIPGFNEDDAHIYQLIAFLRSLGKREINILPLHNLGSEKYLQLGMKGKNGKLPGPELMRHIASLFMEHQIMCYIGGDTPF